MNLGSLKLFFACCLLIFYSCGTTVVSESAPMDNEYNDTTIVMQVASGSWDTVVRKRSLKYNAETKKYDTTTLFLKNAWYDTLEIVSKNSDTLVMQYIRIDYNNETKSYDTTKGQPFTLIYN